MKTFKTEMICKQIEDDFASTYKTAAHFGSTPLYRECMRIIGNASDLRCIVFANDLGVPPVKSLLTILSRKGIQIENLANADKRYMGALMAFLFKKVFLYQNQNDNMKIDLFGVETAALFDEADLFEIAD